MIDSLSNNIDFAKQYEVCFDDLGMYFTSKTNRPEHYMGNGVYAIPRAGAFTAPHNINLLFVVYIGNTT